MDLTATDLLKRWQKPDQKAAFAALFNTQKAIGKAEKKVVIRHHMHSLIKLQLRVELSFLVWSAVHAIPFRSFDGSHWKDVQLEANFQLRGRATISTVLLPAAASVVKSCYQERLKTTQSCAVSFDGAKSSLSGGDKFLSIAYHFLDEEFILHRYFIDLIRILGSQTGTSLNRDC